jgi:hypothetical protein
VATLVLVGWDDGAVGADGDDPLVHAESTAAATSVKRISVRIWYDESTLTRWRWPMQTPRLQHLNYIGAEK